jgi:hypothetical protein
LGKKYLFHFISLLISFVYGGKSKLLPLVFSLEDDDKSPQSGVQIGTAGERQQLTSVGGVSCRRVS